MSPVIVSTRHVNFNTPSLGWTGDLRMQFVPVDQNILFVTHCLGNLFIPWLRLVQICGIRVLQLASKVLSGSQFSIKPDEISNPFDSYLYSVPPAETLLMA